MPEMANVAVAPEASVSVSAMVLPLPRSFEQEPEPTTEQFQATPLIDPGQRRECGTGDGRRSAVGHGDGVRDRRSGNRRAQDRRSWSPRGLPGARSCRCPWPCCCRELNRSCRPGPRPLPVFESVPVAEGLTVALIVSVALFPAFSVTVVDTSPEPALFAQLPSPTGTVHVQLPPVSRSERVGDRGGRPRRRGRCSSPSPCSRSEPPASGTGAVGLRDREVADRFSESVSVAELFPGSGRSSRPAWRRWPCWRSRPSGGAHGHGDRDRRCLAHGQAQVGAHVSEAAWCGARATAARCAGPGREEAGSERRRTGQRSHWRGRCSSRSPCR